jgi:hypothetical protein
MIAPWAGVSCVGDRGDQPKIKGRFRGGGTSRVWGFRGCFVFGLPQGARSLLGGAWVPHENQPAVPVGTCIIKR